MLKERTFLGDLCFADPLMLMKDMTVSPCDIPHMKQNHLEDGKCAHILYSAIGHFKWHRKQKILNHKWPAKKHNPYRKCYI